MIQVTVPNFFYFDEISNKAARAKKNIIFLKVAKSFLALAALFLRWQNKKIWNSNLKLFGGTFVTEILL